jgi:glucosamine-6-phosphate deaminase
VYRELIRLHREEGLDFRHVTTFNLDEYVGLPPEHPASYHAFMRERFFRHVNLDPARTHLPDGMAGDLVAEGRAYEDRIADAGGIDIQLLGIGADGHIGFNEPTSSLGSRTRAKTLTERTRRDNARFFGALDSVPHECLTMGIGTILASRTCLLLAFGEVKAEAVAGAVEGPVSSMNPASALQFHADARIFLDPAAASRLRLRDYYADAFAREPLWRSLLATPSER